MQKEEDKNLSSLEVTRKNLHGIMNHIEFTTETEEEINGWLYTLDTSLKVDKNNMNKVDKFYSSYLERLVGEATRILLRKNSKSCYNRLGIARLSLNPDEVMNAGWNKDR